MQTINLKKIIEDRDLDKKEVAQQLFPKHRFPMLALKRVIDGIGVLDANQISKFSLLSGVPIASLYVGTDWKAKCRDGVHTFTNGEFTAELTIDTGTTKLFHNKSMFHSFVLHSRVTPLIDYFEELNNLILKFNKDASN